MGDGSVRGGGPALRFWLLYSASYVCSSAAHGSCVTGRSPRSAVGRAAAACVWYVGPCLILLFGFALTVLGLLDAVKSVAEGDAVCVHHHNHTS